MTPPPIRTRVLGHPLVVLPVTGLAALMVYAWTQQGDAWPLALVALALAAISLKANERMAEYKAWKRAWDAMGGTPSRSHGWKWAGTVLVALGATYLAGTADTPLSHGIIGLLLAGLAGLVLLVVIGKLWRAVARRKPARMVPVAICATPALPVPALRAAYAALPDYCLRLLAGR